MPLKPIIFVINPRAGVDRLKAIEKDIKKHLDTQVFSYEIVATQHEQHGTEIAKEAALKGIYAVAAVGGDGSVNDVAKGLYGSSCKLAILPKGSGNGLARSLGIPIKVKEAIRLINKDHVVNIDVAFANEHLFLSNMGVGFDTVVARAFKKSTARGLKSYSRLVTQKLFSYKSQDWEIEIDDVQLLHKKAFMLNVANGRQFGYNFRIAPQASITDQALDLVIVKDFPRILGLSIVKDAFSGNLHRNSRVETYRCKKVVFRHNALRYLQTDGDVYDCSTEVVVTLAPHQLSVLGVAGKSI